MALTSRVVHRAPDILGGTPVFVETCAPMRTLADYLEAGDLLDVFLDHFSVIREQAIAALSKGNVDCLCGYYLSLFLKQ